MGRLFPVTLLPLPTPPANERLIGARTSSTIGGPHRTDASNDPGHSRLSRHVLPAGSPRRPETGPLPAGAAPAQAAFLLPSRSSSRLFPGDRQRDSRFLMIDTNAAVMLCPWARLLPRFFRLCRRPKTGRLPAGAAPAWPAFSCPLCLSRLASNATVLAPSSTAAASSMIGAAHRLRLRHARWPAGLPPPAYGLREHDSGSGRPSALDNATPSPPGTEIWVDILAYGVPPGVKGTRPLWHVFWAPSGPATLTRSLGSRP